MVNIKFYLLRTQGQLIFSMRSIVWNKSKKIIFCLHSTFIFNLNNVTRESIMNLMTEYRLMSMAHLHSIPVCLWQSCCLKYILVWYHNHHHLCQVSVSLWEFQSHHLLHLPPLWSLFSRIEKLRNGINHWIEDKHKLWYW